MPLVDVCVAGNRRMAVQGSMRNWLCFRSILRQGQLEGRL